MQFRHYPFVAQLGIFLIVLFSARAGAGALLPLLTPSPLPEKPREVRTPERVVLLRLQQELRYVLLVIEQAQRTLPEYEHKHIDYVALDREVRSMLRTIDAYLTTPIREPRPHSPLTYFPPR